jgi:hypothetical protein
VIEQYREALKDVGELLASIHRKMRAEYNAHPQEWKDNKELGWEEDVRITNVGIAISELYSATAPHPDKWLPLTPEEIAEDKWP